MSTKIYEILLKNKDNFINVLYTTRTYAMYGGRTSWNNILNMYFSGMYQECLYIIQDSWPNNKKKVQAITSLKIIIQCYDNLD